jgi:L-2-hydroxyglutarate oxidase
MDDVIITGGGIVGLATAYRILQLTPGLKLSVLEKENEPARHQTGNNSGVIHSGIYYKPGSLKARNCIEGYKQLTDFCSVHAIPYEICGKIIVATTSDEIPALDRLFARGSENGLKGLKRLNADEIKEYEPHVTGLSAVHVPQTGIVDYKMVSIKLVEEIIRLGGKVHFNEKVVNIIQTDKNAVIETESNEYPSRLTVNCAGLYSDKIASLTDKNLNVKIIPFRGEYYKIRPEKKHLVRNLVYPVPDPEFPFLGVHFTRMINGGVEAGPNAVLAYAREGYTKSKINPSELAETLFWPGFRKIARKYWKTGLEEIIRSYSKKAFTKALQRLIPEISENDLEKGGAGVRAQACDKAGFLLDDFLILENKFAVNVCNAPSPAATSSLAIGTYISKIINRRLSE